MAMRHGLCGEGEEIVPQPSRSEHHEREEKCKGFQRSLQGWKLAGALFKLQDDSLKQGREQKRRKDLSDLKEDIPRGQGATLRLANWPDRSHQPRGRSKGELHRLA
jgi:hypothetical protein